jgi:hypothetical protein
VFHFWSSPSCCVAVISSMQRRHNPSHYVCWYLSCWATFSECCCVFSAYCCLFFTWWFFHFYHDDGTYACVFSVSCWFFDCIKKKWPHSRLSSKNWTSISLTVICWNHIHNYTYITLIYY